MGQARPGPGRAELAQARRADLFTAATRVFLRYGFRKASMDEIAREAGLSRQGLYLHFPTKEALFQDALADLLDRSGEAAKAALSNEAAPLEARLLEAFVAVHGHAIGTDGGAHMAELLAASAKLLGTAVDDHERAFAAQLVKAIKASRRVGAASVRDVVDTLLFTSQGLKHRATSRADYLRRMRTAIRVVCGRLEK